MIRGKKGQVFLVAAVIIVGLIFGANRAVNYVNTGKGNEAFYYLTEELDFEVGRVLDYGVINAGNLGVSLDQFTLNFLDEYTENIVREEVVYVYLNPPDKLRAIHYDSSDVLDNSIQLAIGESIIDVPIQHISSQVVSNADISYLENTVNVIINDITYNFNLREGQGIYFVIIKDDNEEEKFVSVK
jgi:hypothetical protein